jgi:hypothetical protein
MNGPIEGAHAKVGETQGGCILGERDHLLQRDS